MKSFHRMYIDRLSPNAHTHGFKFPLSFELSKKEYHMLNKNINFAAFNIHQQYFLPVAHTIPRVSSNPPSDAGEAPFWTKKNWEYITSDIVKRERLFPK